MRTHVPSLRRILLTTATIAVALSGCVTTDKTTNGGKAATPVIAGASTEDPMLAAPPPSDAAGNGSQRVPLGQLAANAPAAKPTNAKEFMPASVPPAPVATAPTGAPPMVVAQAPAGAPMLLVPAAGSTQVSADAMNAAPPLIAPKVEAPKLTPPVVAQKAPEKEPEKAPEKAPEKTAEKTPAKPAVKELGPIGPMASEPQPETLQRMAAAKAAKGGKAAPVPAAQPVPAPQLPPPVVVAEPKPEPKVEPVIAKAEPALPAPKLKLNIPPAGTKAPREMVPEPQDTVVISSTSTAPVHDTREFIPASLMANAAPTQAMSDAPGSMLSRPLSAAEKNVAQRFEVLKALLDQNLITPDEYMHHRSANLGALLPYTKDPAAVGLERPAPSADAVVARLEALRRSLEMRAISTKQQAMERSMILNALLPESPTDRMPDMPPPEDILQAATLISHLQTLRGRSLISADEFGAERNAIESYIKTGKMPGGATTTRTAAEGRAAQAATAAKQAEAAKAAADAKDRKTLDAAKALEDELTAPVPGPVLHLASFRTKEAASKGWQEALDRNKALLGSVKEIVRKIDLGQQKGVFYRLMAGPYPTLAAAETACIQLKQNNQFCRASADGS